MKIDKVFERVFSLTLLMLKNIIIILLTREDEAHEKNPEKILRNANIDKDGNLIVKRADWTN